MALVTQHLYSRDLGDYALGELYDNCEEEAEWIAERLVGACDVWQYPLPDRSRESGAALPPSLCDFFGRKLGHDFSTVRMHMDADAAEAARRLGAEAFTVGSDIVFAAGRYAPETPGGLRLLTHELVHVVQQGCVQRRGRGTFTVECRAPLGMQRQVNPQRIYEAICPPGSQLVSYPSTTRIGTAYGKWLGIMYVTERKPDPYCLIDFSVYYRGQWGNATIFNLHRGGGDPGVSLAFVNRTVDATWRWPSRTDILDAQRDEIYEIKPVAGRDEGVSQLQGYIEALNMTATTTGPIFTAPRTRLWRGGSWDPTRYPLVIPGAHGRSCLIHAWADPQVLGLILYDIVCCKPNESEEQSGLVATKVASVSRPILDAQPQFARMLDKALKEHLPRAPRGSGYAFLVTPRVFETYVLGPWAREQDKQLERVYGLRLGPVQAAFLLELFVAGHVLTGPLTDLIYISSGFMYRDEIVKLWGVQAVVGGMIAVAALGVILVGPEIAVAAAVSPEVGATAAGLLAAEEAGVVLTTTETLIVATAVPPAAAAVVVGGASEAIVVGSSVPAWMIGGVGGGVGPGMGTGLGVVGVIVTAFVAGDAQASPTPGASPPANIAGADELYLAPFELLAPKDGEIKLNSEVYFGGERYFIIGLASASETS